MALLHGHDIRLFALSSNKPLSEKIASFVGVPLSESTISKFDDGELRVEIKDSVRGADCFLIQSTSSPVNEHYMELFIFIDALKRASAKSINVIMPYYGYSRQNKTSLAREPISAKLVADLLSVAGASRLLCLELHDAEIQGFFNIPIDNFSALHVMASYLKEADIDDVVVISPDHGGALRAREFADYFSNAPIAIIDKRRPKPNQAEALSIVGDVKGKNAIIVDDIIDTGGTAIAAIKLLKEKGAKKVYMCATHALLNGNAIKNIEDSELEELVITDSVYLPKEKQSKKIKMVSVKEILGKGILDVLDHKIS